LKFDVNHDTLAALRNDEDFKTNSYFSEELYSKAEDAYYDNKTEFLDMLAELD